MDWYQGGPRYAFHSFHGEPIELDITAGRLAQYRGRGDAHWWLRRTQEKNELVVAEGRMPLDNEPRHLSLAVPTNGTYILEFKSNGSGWSVTYPTNKPASVLWARGGQAGFECPVFYVPKGTKQLQYFWNGYTHEIYGPTGKPLEKIKGHGVIATIPVPEGMDGQVWSMRAELQSAWFMNIPNVVAATQQSLMIPRKLAEKDGLQIRNE